MKQKTALRHKLDLCTKIGLFSLTLLFAVTSFSLLSPTVKSHADEDVDVSMEITDVVSLTVNTNELKYTLMPSPNGSFDSRPVIVTVDTNSKAGYDLYFSSSDNNTSMTSQTSDGTVSSNFSDSVTSSTMENNSWGYSLDNEYFSAIPSLENASIIVALDHFPVLAERSNTVNIGIKINDELPLGNYSKVVSFTALVHTPVIPYGTTMQTFSCDAATIGIPITLVDERDDKEYTVRRQPDGNCWMYDNLRISGVEITGELSNVPDDYTFELPESGYDGSNYYEDPRVFITSTAGYYNFFAATAGWGSPSNSEGDAPMDICPKGWRLPKGGEEGGDFIPLMTSFESFNDFTESTNFTTASGYYCDSSAYGICEANSQGYYWSSTPESWSTAYALALYGSSVNPTYYGSRVQPLTIRCLAESTPEPPEPVIMQNFACNTLVIAGDPIELTDSRDGNKYSVRRQADGNCWMLDNLRLSYELLTSEDTNLPDGVEFDMENDLRARVAIDEEEGGYYDFYTATAGWGTSEEYNQNGGGNSPQDICPKGWRLPTGGDNGDFANIYSYYNSSAAMRGMVNFTLSGLYIGGSSPFASQGENGYFWSSTMTNTNLANNLQLTESNVWPAAGGWYGVHDTGQGLSIRCIAEPIVEQDPYEGIACPEVEHNEPLTTMQAFSCGDINENDIVTLTDSRDGTEYSVGKYSGYCWMRENLRISNIEVSNETTNFDGEENFTIPASSLSGFGENDMAENSVYIDSSCGGYYSFYTATAGYGEYVSDEESLSYVDRSICPKGWNLPEADDDYDDLNDLYTRFNSPVQLRLYPNLNYSGGIINNEMITYGEFGVYLTGNASGSNLVKAFVFDSNYVASQNEIPRSAGIPIRCVQWW